jgi:hypothetical protein
MRKIRKKSEKYRKIKNKIIQRGVLVTNLNNWATTSTGIETGIDNHGWTSINRNSQEKEQGIKLPQ